MKVLWYEISIPGTYNRQDAVIAGWQDSLQEIVMQHNDIELFVAFRGNIGMVEKVIDGVHYIPLCVSDSWPNKMVQSFNHQYIYKKLMPIFISKVKEIAPDVIHIFGTEWGLGKIAKYTDVPVVIHMMGCIAPYSNAKYPPGYSVYDFIKAGRFSPKRIYQAYKEKEYFKSWIKFEQENINAVANYMGRTSWDKAMCELFHPNCRYFYCSEALRPSFTEKSQKWMPKDSNEYNLITVGCTTHWKGMDVVLKTAHILKKYGVCFRWQVAGNMPFFLKKEIETKEKMKFSENNISILGFIDADNIVEKMLDSDIYVHTAYIENSPNSLCEAQMLGLPIVATNVGGIPSLIENNKEGILIPANDPYRMAYEIISLLKDKERQMAYSMATMERAQKRHNPESIYKDLLHCYEQLIKYS